MKFMISFALLLSTAAFAGELKRPMYLVVDRNILREGHTEDKSEGLATLPNDKVRIPVTAFVKSLRRAESVRFEQVDTAWIFEMPFDSATTARRFIWDIENANESVDFFTRTDFEGAESRDRIEIRSSVSGKSLYLDGTTFKVREQAEPPKVSIDYGHSSPIDSDSTFGER